MKKWLIRIVLFFIVLLTGVLLYVEFNKKNLLAAGIAEANNMIQGSIAYENADISIFSSFPNIQLKLNRLVVRDTFADHAPVLDVQEARVNIPILSLFGEVIKIQSFALNGGNLYLEQYADGSTNYDLANTSATSTAKQSSIDIDMNRFDLRQIDITFEDELSNSIYRIKAFSNTGKLRYHNQYIGIVHDFNGEVVLPTSIIGSTYQIAVKGKMQTLLNPTMDSLGIKNAAFSLNDLPVYLNGSVLFGNSVAYKLDFGSPSTEIKRLVSMLSSFYTNQYEDLISDGRYVLKGDISGRSDQTYPIYKLSILAEDGRLKYPQRNTQIDQLNFALIIQNEHPSTRYTKLIVNDLNIRSGSNTIMGSFASRPEGKRHKVSLDLNANIDFKEVAESLVLPETTLLSGRLKGRMAGNGTINIEQQKMRPDDQRFSSDILIEDFSYTDDSTSLSLYKARIKGDKEYLSFDFTDIKYLDALDINAKGYIKEPLKAAMLSDHIIVGDIEIRADVIDIDRLTPSDAQSLGTQQYRIPRTEISYFLNANQIKRSPYVINDVEVRGMLKPMDGAIRFEMSDFLGSPVTGSGILDGLSAYMINGDTLKGTLNIVSNRIDLDLLLGISDEVALDQSEQTTEILPDNIRLDIDYKSDQIVYKNINILKSLGRISLGEQEVKFENRGVLFGGQIALVGALGTKDIQGYDFDLRLELKGLEFSKTASGLQLFQQLIPLARILDGEFTASLNWDSELNADFVPNLNTLHAYGVLETRDGGIRTSLPIDSFVRSLKIVNAEQQALKISDTKKYFIVEDGKVLVKDIKLQSGDVNITMSGFHSFNQKLDYKLKIDIPQSKLNADGLLRQVQQKIQFSRLLQNAGDDVTIQVEADMIGTILNPKFQITGVNLKKGDLIESIGRQIINTAESTKDSIETALTDTINDAVNQANEIIDSLSDNLKQSIDSTRQELESIKDSAKTILDTLVQNQKEQLEEESEEILQDILSGNTDSLESSIEDIFKRRQQQLDSLSNKYPIKWPKNQ